MIEFPENCKKLFTDIETQKKNWNERSQFCIAKIGNLSNSDLDSLMLYASNHVSNGGKSFGNLIEPMGNLKKILDAYDIK